MSAWRNPSVSQFSRSRSDWTFCVDDTHFCKSSLLFVFCTVTSTSARCCSQKKANRAGQSASSPSPSAAPSLCLSIRAAAQASKQGAGSRKGTAAGQEKETERQGTVAGLWSFVDCTSTARYRQPWTVTPPLSRRSVCAAELRRSRDWRIGEPDAHAQEGDSDRQQDKEEGRPATITNTAQKQRLRRGISARSAAYESHRGSRHSLHRTSIYGRPTS